MGISDMASFHESENVNDFHKKLLDQVPDLIFKMIWTKENGYAIVFVSKSVKDIYGCTVGEFMKDPILFHRGRTLYEDKDALRKKIDKARINLHMLEHEYRVMLPKKGLRWIRVTAKPYIQEDESIYFYGRASDITKLKNQENKLQVSEERYKFALNAASEGIWDWNMITDECYLSSQSVKILGMEEQEITAPVNFWTDKIHPDDIEGHTEAKNAHLEGRLSMYESIYRVLTTNGKYRWVLSRGRVVQYDDNNLPIRAVGTHKDITQLKEKEIELANTINIIGSQNNRLSNFAHIVSHNLRSHASNLKMLLDLFKNADEKEREEMLEHLEAISDGLYVTIGHLKELVEIQFEVKLTKENLNLRHYLKNILNILNNEIKKHGIDVEVNIPLDVTVNYNPAYLESILLNFTTNAIKYSSPKRKSVVSYDFEIVDGKKVLSVSDNGLGIDLKKHKNSLFGMYKTFHKNQNSRGIGLFITKNQVEAMGGSIEVYSEVNKGTTFKIIFNE